MNEQRRNFDYITLSRGFGIVAVAMAHAAIPSIRTTNTAAAHLWYLAYSIALPLFICLSGHLFEKGLGKYARQGYGSFIRGKFSALMVPYFAFSILAYGGVAIASRFPETARLLERFHFAPRGVWEAALEIISLEDLVSKHLWFCYTLFLIFAVSYPLRRFLKSFPGLVVAFALYLASIAYHDDLPALVERVSHYLLFFHAGRWTGALDAWFRPRFMPLYFAAGAGTYIVMETVGTRNIGFFGGSLSFVLGAVGVLFFATLARCLTSVGAMRTVDRVGEYSYDIYLIHQPVLTAGTAGLLQYKFTWLSPWTIIVMAATFGIVSSYLISRYFIRPVPFLRRILLGMKTGSRYEPARAKTDA